MEYLPSRKQLLLKHGRIEAITRGRISQDNLNWLMEQFNNGQRFSDWEPEVKDNRVTNKVKPKVVKEEIPFEINIYWPENEYRAIEWRDGKKVIRSMREACNNCRASLVQCSCMAYNRTPKIVAFDGRGSVEVSIERIPA